MVDGGKTGQQIISYYLLLKRIIILKVKGLKGGRKHYSDVVCYSPKTEEEGG